MKNIIIFDLDGTLALIDHRRHLVEKNLAFELWFDALPWEAQREYKVKMPKEHIIEHFVKTAVWKPDWDGFFEACDKDEPNHPVIQMFIHLNSIDSRQDFELIIFSGRSQAVAEKTAEWLEKYDIRPSKIFMRPDKDYTPDDQLKEMWLTEIGGPERVFCVFDDRQKVVDMWRSKGITCFQVAPGNF